MVAALFALAAAGVTGEVLVTTTSGKLIGHEADKVIQFLGVPFAKPPVGTLRFQAPEPTNWTGTLDARQFSPWCLPAGGGSEDCLYLNIFMPLSRVANTAAPPVMFYIHGGGFMSGGANHQGANLTARSGAIVVSVNYRMGVFGFFASAAPPPNLGLLDQRLALQWVKDNAAAFGGDPNRIMIFGCSAGAASVAGHLVMPESYNLYHAAALSSMGGHKGWYKGVHKTDDDFMQPSSILRNSQQLAQAIGCASSEDWPCLSSAPVAKLLDAEQTLHFAPAMPREGDFPLGLIRRGQWNRVPLIVGGANCESCEDAADRIGPPRVITREVFLAALEKEGFTGDVPGSISAATVEQWYASRIAQEGYWRTFARILSDSDHACNAALVAEAAAGSGAQVWRYFFTVRKPELNLPGATHGTDIDWVIGSHHAHSVAETDLMSAMENWWSSLAAFSDPNIGASSLLKWPLYDPSRSPHVMVLGLPPHLNTTESSARPECEHWKPYLGWGAEFTAHVKEEPARLTLRR